MTDKVLPNYKKVQLVINTPYGQITDAQALSMSMELGRHTVCSLQLGQKTPTVSKNQFVMPENTPISISWGRTPGQLATWYGYVLSHDPAIVKDFLSYPQLTYTLIGTSVKLNSQHTRSWTNVTDSYVARQICKEAGFATVSHASNTVRPYIVQSGQSDFIFCNYLASLSGFEFWADGPTMYFIDPVEVIGSPNQATILSFNIDRKPGYWDAAQSFELTQGSQVPDTGVLASRTVYGLDNTNAIIQATSNPSSGSPSISTVENSYPASSYQDAQNQADAVTKQNQQWISATCTVQSDTRLQPGQVIDLQGQSLLKGTEGFWLIVAVQHRISPATPAEKLGRFNADLAVIRNAPSGQQYSGISGLGTTLNQAVLNAEGSWQAQVTSETVYATG